MPNNSYSIFRFNYFLSVYQAVKNENAEDRKLQELEDKFLGKRKEDDSFM